MGCKQIIVSVMWTASASLSAIFPLKTMYEAGFVGAPTQWHPPSNSLCLYCTSPENHILTRGTQSTASPPPNGKTVTQSELFTDDGAAPLKVLQSVLSLETILRRVRRGFKEKKQLQRLTAGCWWSHGTWCPPLMWLPRWRAPFPFPRMHWGVWDWKAVAKDTCNMNGQGKVSHE